MTFDRDKLLHICKGHTFGQAGMAVPEPYIPFFPQGPLAWNGVLVVAVAQNLSDTNRGYRSWLVEASQQVRQDRLSTYFAEYGIIGVGPWDDGTIKLAIAALRGADAVKRVAVSNAVLWSGGDSGTSEALSKQAERNSVSFWTEVLEVMNPAEVIAFGAIAGRVMKESGAAKHGLVEMPGPFSRIHSIGFKMDLDRLLLAFPEVAEAWENLEGRACVKNKSLAIHCACAAVSREMGL
jgi:hypothetical protein